LLARVVREPSPGNKHKQQLIDVAICHDAPALAVKLIEDPRLGYAEGFAVWRASLARKTYVTYFARNFKDILRQCDQHGLEHRLVMNLTPLMAAAAAGNVPLVEALIERGADREAIDHFGSNALHWAMREAFADSKFARGPFAALYELLAPASVDVTAGQRLVRIDRHLSEYFLFQTLWALFKSRFMNRQRRPYAAFEAQAILDAWAHLPANVVRPERNKRQHLSSVLSRNEVERDYAYNRALFLRVAQGWYQLNPRLSVRMRTGDGEAWVPVYKVLNLAFINEFVPEHIWPRIDDYLALAQLPERTVPIAAAEMLARRQAAMEREREAEAAREALERKAAAARAASQRPEGPPKWGTPEARRMEIERVRRELEEKYRK
jgi:hypothetical protein